jgi:hypothetical protein
MGRANACRMTNSATRQSILSLFHCCPMDSFAGARNDGNGLFLKTESEMSGLLGAARAWWKTTALVATMT